MSTGKFLALDRLGSMRLPKTTQTTAGYYPYGEEQQASTTEGWNFATYYRHPGTELDYAVNRYYSPRLGRFISPDPYRTSAGLENPQSWNRYAYVLNDPVNFYDPAGLMEARPQSDYPDFGSIGRPGASQYPYMAGSIREWDDERGTNSISRFEALDPDCQRGLKTALPIKEGTNPQFAAQAWMGALDRAERMMSVFSTAGDANGIDASLLAAIAIRETGVRNVPQSGGQGMGVFQIDLDRNPSVTATQASNPTWAANWVAKTLAGNEASLAGRFGLTGDALIDAVADSYNAGLRRISRRLGAGQNPDAGTTGKNYGSNILDLINCFH